MKVAFEKYQGTGNDFIIIDNWNNEVRLSNDHIRFLCDRRNGVGADGLMMLCRSEKSDFRMDYYNADGEESSLCGNGGRCIVHFAFKHQYIKPETNFQAIDGLHKAVIDPVKQDIVDLAMNNVTGIEKLNDSIILDTGSPHYIIFVDSADDINVVEEGRKVRYNDRFREMGINVNFVEVKKGSLLVRTYERGVEDETLSCGTGVTAAVIAAAHMQYIKPEGTCRVATKGGELEVHYRKSGSVYDNIRLKGPATFVFKAEINL